MSDTQPSSTKREWGHPWPLLFLITVAPYAFCAPAYSNRIPVKATSKLLVEHTASWAEVLNKLKLQERTHVVWCSATVVMILMVGFDYHRTSRHHCLRLTSRHA